MIWETKVPVIHSLCTPAGVGSAPAQGGNASQGMKAALTSVKGALDYSGPQLNDDETGMCVQCISCFVLSIVVISICAYSY